MSTPALAHRRLVIATGNPGKLRELRALLDGLPWILSSLGELGIASPDEPGATFAENALIKARHAARAAAGGGAGHAAAVGGPMAAIADDSGLEVDALGGAPGVRSARYAGPGADDASNNAALIAALAGVPAERRRARYRCALVFVDGPDDPDPVVAESAWEGFILAAPRGVGGFGYDPYFWVPELGATAAELDPAVKNGISHRGKALRELRRRLEARGVGADGTG